jgi:hypothetical protein
MSLLAALGCGGAAAAAEAAGPADLVVLGAKIWTGDAAHPSATALAAIGERLVAVGSDEEIRARIGPATRVLQAGGRRLVPGFIDAHTHFLSGGLQLLAPELRSARSKEEFVTRVGRAAAALPAGAWLQDGRWDHENWPGAPLPDRTWIDAAAGSHPVLVERIDGHMALASSLALRLAGVTSATRDPDGGVIVRDAGGAPTGVLKDAAIELVRKAVPARSPAELDAALAAATRHAWQLGVTSVQDITMWDEWEAYRRARARGDLGVRVYARTPLATLERQRDLVAREGAGDAWLRLGGVKAYADGSLGSSTALFFEPYADHPETSGVLADDFFPEGNFERRALEADRAGLQVSTHAIGEKANALVLDVYERVARADGARDRRFRIEHAQHLRAADVPRFARLGVIASMQPVHLADDGRWAARRLGPQRVHDSYVLRSLLDAGATLAFGTDWPVAPLDPMLGLKAAVTRRTDDGAHPGGWLPEQRITVEEALVAYTAGAARAELAERDKGTLAPGKLADFVLLSADPLAIDPVGLDQVRAVWTVVGGRLVHELPAPR